MMRSFLRISRKTDVVVNKNNINKFLEDFDIVFPETHIVGYKANEFGKMLEHIYFSFIHGEMSFYQLRIDDLAMECD